MEWVDKLGVSAFAAELKVAVDLALRCGDLINKTQGARVEWKDDADGDGIDPCTATDTANEAMITKELREQFPGHRLIGEEAAAAGGIPRLTDAPTWIVGACPERVTHLCESCTHARPYPASEKQLPSSAARPSCAAVPSSERLASFSSADPIDGTQNFVHGLPLCCVSIGFCVDGRPILGVVYSPAVDELFVGLHGQGAYLNGRRLRVDGCSRLSQAMVLTDPGYERSAEGVARMAKAYAAVLSVGTRAVRIVGSSVLSLCYVACGRCSASYFGLHEKDCPKPWDFCAAHVIASEAGATFARLGGSALDEEPRHGDDSRPFDIYCASGVCAGTAQVATELQQLLLKTLGEFPYKLELNVNDVPPPP